MQQIKLNSKTLVDALSKVKPIVPKKSILYTLECVLFEIDSNNKTKIHATDLHNYITVQINAVADNEGMFCLELGRLMKLIKSLPFSDITITHDDINKLCTINCNGSDYTLEAVPFGDFPKQMEVDDVIVQKSFSERLIKDCKQALPFVSTDTLRPAMTGVCFEYSKNKLRIAATDSHALFLSDSYDVSSTVSHNFIVDGRSLKIICGLSDKSASTLIFTKLFAIYNNGNVSIITRLIDVKYPDFQSLIPLHTKCFSVDRVSMLQAINSLLPVANAVTQKLDIEINGAINIEADDLDYNSHSSTKVEYKYKTTPDFHFSFNGRQLIRIFEACDANNIIVFNDGISNMGFIFKGEDSKNTFLAMPLVVGV